MRETHLKRWIWGIGIAAFTLIVALVLVWKFKFYDQVTAELAATNTEFEGFKTEAGNLEANLRAAALEEQKLALAQAQLEYFRVRFRSVPFDLRPEASGARDATWIRLLNEYYLNFGVAAREQLIRAADETGVIINTTIKVQPPPQMPENVVSPPSGFLKPTTGAGTPEGGAAPAQPGQAGAAPAPDGALAVSATGTYPDLLRFFDRISRSPIILVVGNLKLEGTSPATKATFTLTPYMLSSGPSAQVKAPPGAAGAAPAGQEGDPAAVPPGEQPPPPTP